MTNHLGQEYSYTLEEFEKYLATKGQHAVVGRKNSALHCPLAQAISTKYGEQFGVYSGGFWRGATGIMMPIIHFEKGLSDLVLFIDNAKDDYVTREQVEEYIKEVRK